MLNRLQSLDTIDAPFAFGERILPPAPVAAIAPKAVADWTRATIADILTDAERGALAEAFPVPKCIAKPAVDMHDSAPAETQQRCRIPAAESLASVDLSSANDPELRAVAERMATARQQANIRRAYGIGVGLASTEAPAAKADADGWIAHDGRGLPVPGGTVVQVRCRWEQPGDEHVAHDAPAMCYGATAESPNNWWAHTGSDFDILAYRVVPQ